MDRREIKISRWMTIASAVFRAEDSIKDKWMERLASAKGLSGKGRTRLAEEYLRAIAVEIVDNQR